MHAEVAIAGRSPATHVVCGNAPTQIKECISFNQVAKDERSCFFIIARSECNHVDCIPGFVPALTIL